MGNETKYYRNDALKTKREEGEAKYMYALEDTRKRGRGLPNPNAVGAGQVSVFQTRGNVHQESRCIGLSQFSQEAIEKADPETRVKKLRADVSRLLNNGKR